MWVLFVGIEALFREFLGSGALTLDVVLDLESRFRVLPRLGFDIKVETSFKQILARSELGLKACF